jgi:predicted lysophospholipase L1 biosynthesis ABC-type transport system permease subunit
MAAMRGTFAKQSAAAAVAAALSVLLVVLLVVAGVGVRAEEGKAPRAPPKELRIGVLHRPDDCTQTAEYGDRVEVHCTRRLHGPPARVLIWA